MAVKRRSLKQDEVGGRKRFVDQAGQLQDTTPASIKRRRKKALNELERSLSSAERKAIGLPAKRSGKKK